MSISLQVRLPLNVKPPSVRKLNRTDEIAPGSFRCFIWELRHAALDQSPERRQRPGDDREARRVRDGQDGEKLFERGLAEGAADIGQHINPPYRRHSSQRSA